MTLGAQIIGIVTVLALPLHCAAQQPDAAVRRPAVLFVGSGYASCGYDVALRLDKSCFALGRMHGDLDQQALTWDEVRPCNVLVVTDLGRCNADMTLPKWTQETLATVQRFVDAGGGVLYVTRFGQMATEAPAQEAFLKPLGLTPLFAEMPVDPGTEVEATAWKLPFSHTDGIAPSPISDSATSLWYPTPHTRGRAEPHHPVQDRRHVAGGRPRVAWPCRPPRPWSASTTSSVSEAASRATT